MEKQDLLSLILERTSIRHFEKEKEVPEEALQEILLAGISAPSAGNIQPRTFIIVKDETVKEGLYEMCENQAFMKSAPVWIVTCVDLHRHLKAAKLTGVDYAYTGILPYTLGVLDASLSMENMVIAAEALGLGSVMIGSIIEHPEEARELLKLPEHCLALCILCIGYPQEKRGARKKWDYDVIVTQDSYKDIQLTDVSEYWRETMINNLRRSKKEVSPEVIERVCRERPYGKAYASHYKEGFVKTTNAKLMEFLQKSGLLKS